MYDADIDVSMFLDTGINLIIPSVSISPYILIVGVDGVVVDPDIMMLPDNTVFPSSALLPICRVDPLILSEPVNVRVFDPLKVKLAEPLKFVLSLLNCKEFIGPPGMVAPPKAITRPKPSANSVPVSLVCTSLWYV